MKKKLDFSKFIDLIESLNLKEKSIDLCIENISKYKLDNRVDSEKILEELDMDDLYKEIKVSSISFKKVYSGNDSSYEVIIILAYYKEDLIFEYKLIYDLNGKLKSTKLIYDFNKELDI